MKIPEIRIGGCMKLEEFIKTMTKDLADFQKYWEDESKNSPDLFSPEMGEGDWFDQFIFFLENRDCGETSE